MKYKRLAFILIILSLFMYSRTGSINTKKQKENEPEPIINTSFNSVKTIMPETSDRNIYAFGNYLVMSNVFINGKDVDWMSNTKWYPGKILGTVRKNPYSYEEFNNMLSKSGHSVSISDFNSISELPIGTEIYCVKSSSNYPANYFFYSGTILLAKVGNDYIPYRVFYGN